MYISVMYIYREREREREIARYMYQQDQCACSLYYYRDHLGTIWEMDSMKLSVSLRNRTFLSAWIDPSSLPEHRRTNFKKSCSRKKSNIQKELKQYQKQVKRA